MFILILLFPDFRTSLSIILWLGYLSYIAIETEPGFMSDFFSNPAFFNKYGHFILKDWCWGYWTFSLILGPILTNSLHRQHKLCLDTHNISWYLHDQRLDQRSLNINLIKGWGADTGAAQQLAINAFKCEWVILDIKYLSRATGARDGAGDL